MMHPSIIPKKLINNRAVDMTFDENSNSPPRSTHTANSNSPPRSTLIGKPAPLKLYEINDNDIEDKNVEATSNMVNNLASNNNHPTTPIKRTKPPISLGLMNVINSPSDFSEKEVFSIYSSTPKNNDISPNESSPEKRDSGIISLGQTPDKDDISFTELVELPRRYQECLKNGNYQLPTPAESSSRETELTAAMKWLRQEMVLMKQQDKQLLKQFEHLRTTITDIKECQLEESSRLGYSCQYLDMLDSPSLDWSPLDDMDVLSEFKNRTAQSMPCSPMVDRDLVNEFRRKTPAPISNSIWYKTAKEEFV